MLSQSFGLGQISCIPMGTFGDRENPEPSIFEILLKNHKHQG